MDTICSERGPPICPTPTNLIGLHTLELPQFDRRGRATPPQGNITQWLIPKIPLIIIVHEICLVILSE